MIVRPPTLIAVNTPDEVETAFSAALDARFLREAGTKPPAEIAAAAAGCTAVVVAPGVRAGAELIGLLPGSVRILGTYSVGFDHVDLAAARAKGLAVLNTPDVLTNAAAETAMLLLLGAMRRATESIALIRSGRWTGWTPTQLVGLELTGKRLGIFGMGRIGQAIARRGRAFEMAVVYHNRSRLPPEREGGASFVSEAELLATSDALVLACPLTDETRKFLNEARIAQMKPTAVVVNIARGDVVDDAALIPALASGRLYAAGLDVFSGEPDLDRRYLDLRNAFVLPHIGSSTAEARRMMGQALIDGILALTEGREPPNRLA